MFAEILYLPLLPLDLLLQFFAAGLVGVPGPGGTPIRRCLFLAAAASRGRTHPPYVKRFCAICPAKSMGVSDKSAGKSATVTFTPSLPALGMIVFRTGWIDADDSIDGTIP